MKKCEHGRKHTYLCRRGSTFRMTYRFGFRRSQGTQQGGFTNTWESNKSNAGITKAGNIKAFSCTGASSTLLFHQQIISQLGQLGLERSEMVVCL